MNDPALLPAIELLHRSLPPRAVIADVGAGPGAAAKYLRGYGHQVIEFDYGRDGVRFEDIEIDSRFDALYCSHMLEHCRNPGLTLDRFREAVKVGGYLCIMVPPAKHNIVGGHLTLWNAGLLLYNLVRAHFDCSDARVRCYGYNVAVVFRNHWADYADAELAEDNGDIEALARFFPFPVMQGFDGRVMVHNWTPFHGA